MKPQRHLGLTRTHIPELDHADFTAQVQVEAAHINDAGHMAFTTVPDWLDRCRRAWFAALGLDEQNLEGVGVIVADLQVVYCREAHEGDCLEIRMAVVDPGARSLQLVYRIHDQSTGETVARARTALVFFDYQRRTPVAMPRILGSELERRPPIKGQRI